MAKFSPTSVTSQCEKFDGIVNGRKVAVIDSPGVFDTNLSLDEWIGRINLCIPLAAPGPHVFLFVMKLGRFTEEEEKAVKRFQLLFGEESSRYTMVLFTHGDDLEGESIHQFVRDSPELVDFVREHGGRYHVFNNKDQDPGQVIQLLDQIDRMVTVNGGHNTPEMLQETERVTEEEKHDSNAGPKTDTALDNIQKYLNGIYEVCGHLYSMFPISLRVSFGSCGCP